VQSHWAWAAKFGLASQALPQGLGENSTVASVFEAVITLRIWTLAPKKPAAGTEAALNVMNSHFTKV